MSEEINRIYKLINNGFSELNKKIEALFKRQDEQKEKQLEQGFRLTQIEKERKEEKETKKKIKDSGRKVIFDIIAKVATFIILGIIGLFIALK